MLVFKYNVTGLNGIIDVFKTSECLVSDVLKINTFYFEKIELIYDT